MSSSINTFRRSLGNWQSELDSGGHTPDRNEPNQLRPMFPRSRSFQVTPDIRAGVPPPFQSFEERRITGPFGLASFAGPTLSSLQIVVLDHNNMATLAREANHRPRQIIQDSLPGFTGQQNRQVPTLVEDSRLTQLEQKTALKKLKKEIYNPTPKAIARRLSLYYKDNAKNAFNEMEKLKDEDGKRCAICLEDFEPGQEVVLTPCKHMFHEDCIMPWVKSHGHCPVCRTAFCERMTTASNLNNSNIANVAANDGIAGELISIIRAMEEAFQWGNGAR